MHLGHGSYGLPHAKQSLIACVAFFALDTLSTEVTNFFIVGFVVSMLCSRFLPLGWCGQPLEIVSLLYTKQRPSLEYHSISLGASLFPLLWVDPSLEVVIISLVARLGLFGFTFVLLSFFDLGHL